MTVESLGRHSPRVKELRRRMRDRRPGEIVVDGRRLAVDLMRWRIPIREIYVGAEVEPDPEVVAWADRVFVVNGKVLSAIAPTRHTQGLLVVIDEPDWPSWSGTNGVALYLEEIQDPGNVGAIIRSAASLGAAAVLMSPQCADAYHPMAVRGSAGSVLRMPIERGVTLTDAVARIRATGGEIWATASSGTPVFRWRPSEPVLVLIGAEGRGLSSASLELSDGTVAIPLDREVESLNVSVAAGILLHHLRR